MSLFVEYHLIQNFAPSNLNRDDTGAPKDALFGGHRRARVSSQCFKRAIRFQANAVDAVKASDRGVRTKKLLGLLTERLDAMGHTNAEESRPRIEMALSAAGLKLGDDGKTEYLLFLGQREVEALADLIHEHWADLAGAPADDGKPKRSKKESKADAPDAVKKKAQKLLDGGKAVDVALFGRMLADIPEANQYAACQIAHALSTHRVEREFDYFTAVDDESGISEMISQLEFNSATFYRYAVLDADKLVENLQGDRNLALAGVAAFTDALARAIPTGKQNTFAAHNPPSFVGVVIRRASPFNLANAFEKPVWPDRYKPLTAQSVEALALQAKQLAGFYGGADDVWAFIDLTGAWPKDLGDAQASMTDLTRWVGCQVASHLGLDKAEA